MTIEIKQLVYLGPHTHKSVAGCKDFTKGVPQDVIDPRRARMVLETWPEQFAAVLPCAACAARDAAPAPEPSAPKSKAKA